MPIAVDDTEARLYEMQRFFDERNSFRNPIDPNPVKVRKPVLPVAWIRLGPALIRHIAVVVISR